MGSGGGVQRLQRLERFGVIRLNRQRLFEVGRRGLSVVFGIASQLRDSQRNLQLQVLIRNLSSYLT